MFFTSSKVSFHLPVYAAVVFVDLDVGAGMVRGADEGLLLRGPLLGVFLPAAGRLGKKWLLV